MAFRRGTLCAALVAAGVLTAHCSKGSDAPAAGAKAQPKVLQTPVRTVQLAGSKGSLLRVDHGRMLVAVDGRLSVVDPTRLAVETSRAAGANVLSGASIGPAGKSLATGDSPYSLQGKFVEGHIRMNFETGELSEILEPFYGPISLQFQTDEALIYSVSNGPTGIFDCKTKQQTILAERSLRFSCDEQSGRVALAAESGAGYQILVTSSGENRAVRKVGEPLPRPPFVIGWSGGKTIVAGVHSRSAELGVSYAPPRMYVIDLTTGHTSSVELDFPRGGSVDASALFGDQLVATCMRGAYVQGQGKAPSDGVIVWSVSTGEKKYFISLPGVEAIDFSADGKFLYALKGGEVSEWGL